ncbi:uncharacterized protein LOC144443832 isoform X2 [Glandiceps talaboti]
MSQQLPRKVLQEVDTQLEKNPDTDLSVNVQSNTASNTNSHEDVILDLKRKKDWLENQKLDHLAALSATETLEWSKDQDTLNDRISSLESQLLDHSISHAINEREINCTLYGSMLQNLLQKDSQRMEDGVISEKEKQQLAEMCKRKAELESQILQENQETIEIHNKLEEIKKQCLEMKKSNRDLMLNMQEEQKAKSKFQEGTTECEEYQR